MTGLQIYVLYPRGVRTGGPEALHQLVDTLRSHGQKASLVPHSRTAEAERVPAYEAYDAPESSAAPDIASSVVIAPEIYAHELRRFRLARTFCWWLSIDNSPLFRAERRLADWRSGLADPWRMRDAKSVLDLLVREVTRWRSRLRSMEHLAQSEYARRYLLGRLDLRAELLTDYLPGVSSEAHRETPARQEPPVVAFNPAKGARLAAMVRSALGPSVTWDPIAGLSPEGVVDHLRRADIYLDLGAHPGRDRMPREAAMAGAVTVVARRGSGALAEDVPIPDNHKVEVATDPVRSAVKVLRSVLDGRDRAFRDQLSYRQWIVGQELQFGREVEQLVNRLHEPRGPE